MYNIATLRAAFLSQVGILQSDIPQVPKISAPLTISNTGVYVQDKHPLVSLQNIWYSAPDFNPNNWYSWVSGSDYVSGSVVNVSGSLFQALNNLTNDTVSPPSDSTNWIAYNPFQSWLLQNYNQAVSNLFAEVVRRKKLSHMGKAIMERQQLYRGGGNLSKTIISEGAAVGFEITIQSAEGLLVIIDMLGIQATYAQPDMKYYLYSSTVHAPLNQWDEAIASPTTFTWVELNDGGSPSSLNAIMKYLAQNTQGTYFIIYYQDDLLGQAISKEWDCSSAPCYGCDGANTMMYNTWSRYVTMRSIKVPASALDTDRNLFDTSKIIYGTNTNWGLNLSLTVRCDLTDFIIYSKNLYTDVLAYQLSKEFLMKIAQSARINPNESQIQTKASADLDPKFPGSWINDYNDAVDALNLDMSGFSKVCMPCDNTKKMKRSFIG